MFSRYKTTLKLALQLSITVLCFFYIVFYFVEHKKDIELLTSVKLTPLLLLFFSLLIFLLAQAERVRVILSISGGKILAYRYWARLFILGGFLNKVAPQGGTVYRAVKLKQDYAIKYDQFLIGMIFFVWFDSVLTFFIASVVGVYFPLPWQWWWVSADQLALFICFFLVVSPWLGVMLFRWLPAVRALTPVFLLTMVSGFTLLMSDKQLMIRQLILGMIAMLALTISLYMTYLSLGHELGVHGLALLYILVALSTHINIVPGNMGLRELAIGYVAEITGTGMSVGLLASIIFRTAEYLLQFALALAVGGKTLMTKYRTE